MFTPMRSAAHPCLSLRRAPNLDHGFYLHTYSRVCKARAPGIVPVKAARTRGPRNCRLHAGRGGLTVSKSASCKRLVNPARVIRLRVSRVPISLYGPGPSRSRFINRDVSLAAVAQGWLSKAEVRWPREDKHAQRPRYELNGCGLCFGLGCHCRVLVR